MYCEEVAILPLNITVGASLLRGCLWNLSYVLLPSTIITMVNLGVTLLLRGIHSSKMALLNIAVFRLCVDKSCAK